MLPSGDFVLHTPSPSAAKSVSWLQASTFQLNLMSRRLMPPTVPAGLPTVAIVFARLVIDAHDRGIRPFVVSINDGHEMCTGVTAM
jgi:acyl-CoA oxidase